MSSGKKVNHAVIMAAGRGMRMSPLTDVVPKPMAPYNGTTLIGSGIDCISPHIENIHITVGYKGAMLAKHVVERGITSVFNTEGKDNCWWLFNTLLKNLDEPVFVLTCDNILDLDFGLLAENYFSLGSPLNMVVPVKVVPGLDGDFIKSSGGFVTSLGRNFKTDIYLSGIQVLNPKKINQFCGSQDSFYGLWDVLISKRELVVSSVYPKRWTAVDTIEQLAIVNENL